MTAHLELSNSIVDVLRYFQIFKFPLTISEIHQFCKTKCSISEIKLSLEELIYEKKVVEIESCYLFENTPNLVERKNLGAKIAIDKLVEAKHAAKVINAFPFVRMVGVSGSLSKGYFEKGSDIDFFIVASKDRLWVCRSFLHLFKKLTFIIGKQHNYCMNYFIDETSLEIEEKNQFTAIEIVTLLPQTNELLYNKFMEANKWVKRFVPNTTIQSGDKSSKYKTGVMKWVCERLLDSNRLNSFLMQLTDKKWRSKWRKRGFDMSKYDSAFKTTLTVSKNHPNDYQEKVLNELVVE